MVYGLKNAMLDCFQLINAECGYLSDDIIIQRRR